MLLINFMINRHVMGFDLLGDAMSDNEVAASRADSQLQHFNLTNDGDEGAAMLFTEFGPTAATRVAMKHS